MLNSKFIFAFIFIVQNLFSFGQLEEGEFDKPPSFPGGINEFHKYIQNTISRHNSSKDIFSSGKIIVEFKIDKNGSLINPNITQGIDQKSDSIALETIRNSIKWEPGLKNGEPIEYQLQIPIKFSNYSENQFKKIENTEFDKLNFHYVKKWRQNLGSNFIELKNPSLGNGEIIFLSRLDSNESLETKTLDFKNQGFIPFHKAVEISINNMSARTTYGKLKSQKIVEKLSSEYLVHLIELVACGEKYIIILLYFKDQKEISRERISLFLESIQCK